MVSTLMFKRKRFKLVQTTYLGGETLGIVTYRIWYHVPFGDRVEIKPRIKTMVLKKYGV